MSKSYNINSQTFKTQKQFKEYVQNLLIKRGICEIYPNDNDYLFVLELYKRMNVVEKEIKMFIFGYGKTMSCIYIDDTINCFSWNKCITLTKSSNNANLKIAMRCSIISQVFERKLISNCCYICKKEYNESNGKFEIDHYSIEFSAIVKHFLDQNSISIPN